MAESDPRFEIREATAEPLTKPAATRRVARMSLMISVPLLLVVAAAYYYVANDHYVSTDNAYVHQDKVSVSAEVTGNIMEVAVRENQHVRAGDILFRLDPAPFKIAAAQADATIAGAQVKVGSMEADLSGASVDIDRGRKDVDYFEKAYRRQADLMRTGFTTRASLETAEHDLTEARSRLAEALASAASKRADLATAPSAPGVNPAVLAGRVQKEQALLNLRRTTIRAPSSGIVSQTDRLQVGQLLPLGLPALSIVRDDRNWIEANFKETDLKNMRVGQPVEVEIDAFADAELERPCRQHRSRHRV